jgi:hypothetical protein
VALVIAWGGCFHDRTGAVQQARQAEIDRVGAMGQSKLIMSFCSEDMDEFSKPSQHVVTRENGTRVTQPCGMVAMEILAQDSIAAFIRDVCGGTDSPECGKAHWEMFLARLQERYAFADWSWVLNKCKAYPVECKQWTWIELWATESHNEGVIGWTRSTMSQTNDRYQAAYDRAYLEEVEERRRVGAALSAFGSAMAPKPAVHCTSNTFGTTTSTTCQ